MTTVSPERQHRRREMYPTIAEAEDRRKERERAAAPAHVLSRRHRDEKAEMGARHHMESTKLVNEQRVGHGKMHAVRDGAALPREVAAKEKAERDRLAAKHAREREAMAARHRDDVRKLLPTGG